MDQTIINLLRHYFIFFYKKLFGNLRKERNAEQIREK